MENNTKLESLKVEKAELENIVTMVKDMVYSRETSKCLNEIASCLMVKYRDFRGHMLKTSLKRDLPKKIESVCSYTIKDLLERIEMEKQNMAKNEIRQKKKRTEISVMLLIEKMEPYKDEYIRDSESISEGVRQWECLVSIVESGHVKEHQLKNYGIDLNVPPQKK